MSVIFKKALPRTVKMDLRDPGVTELVEMIRKTDKERIINNSKDPEYIVRISVESPTIRRTTPRIRSRMNKVGKNSDKQFSHRISFEYKY